MLAQVQPVADGGVWFVIVLIALVAVGTLGMFLVRGAQAIGDHKAEARDLRVKQSSYGDHPVMSRPLIGHTPLSRVADLVDAPLTAGQSHVNVNAWLTGNEASTVEDEEDRDITEQAPRQNDLQYQHRLEALATLINAGALGQAEGIEKLFHVTRSGRKDSRYAQIRADLLPLLKKDDDSDRTVRMRNNGDERSIPIHTPAQEA